MLENKAMNVPSDSFRFIDRELSWLAFNDRVLEEVRNTKNPLLERLKFHSIFTSNLDEYFMKRVGLMKRKSEEDPPLSQENKESIEKSLRSIREIVEALLKKQAHFVQTQLLPELSAGGVETVSFKNLSEPQKAWAMDFFKQNFFPVLTPLVVDSGHPFPFISNLSFSIGILLQSPDETAEPVFARVKVPNWFSAWIRLPCSDDSHQIKFISSRDIIINHLEWLFPGMRVISLAFFRVTRSVVVERDDSEDDENDDLLEIVAEELKERRFAEALRLEHSPGADLRILSILQKELHLKDNEIYELPMGIEFYQLEPLAEIRKREWLFNSWIPISPHAFKDTQESIFDSIKKRDLLVHHPFESFSGSVERFIRDASEDPSVVAIKMTIYRTGEDSPFIPYLIRAAAAGKQVACLVELQARFDEERNILAAQALEKAGVHVVYGIKGLKTHSKIALVVRQEGISMRSYVHIGTGNYNVRTAQHYTDLGYFTTNSEITEDVVHLFHHLTGKSLYWHFKKLLVAPFDMRTTLNRMIEREIEHVRKGGKGHIVIKLNNLEDPDLIDSFYRASQAGVKIDLIVRSICCLRPQVKGLSENIRVISILGRFLEHSRVFNFRNGANEELSGEFFIGSSDLMTRNLNSRVEVLTPVENLDSKKQLGQILGIYWNDTCQAWELQPDGSYVKRQSLENPESAQVKLMSEVLTQSLTTHSFAAADRSPERTL
ncbi:polyphosphate kinase 1 [bacterium]|nr:polyphosphate kinase 1 [bacterium]